MSRSAYTISMRDADKIRKHLNKLQEGSETVIKRTVSDIRTRAPGWISKGVRQHYGVDKAGVESASVRVEDNSGGRSIAGVSIKCKGRTLTLTHFGMDPEARPPIKRYKVSATIIKGQCKAVDGAFIIDKTKHSDHPLPFQRRGRARFPVKVVHTLSIPQMIENRAKDTVDNILNENIEKRFNNHVKQLLK